MNTRKEMNHFKNSAFHVCKCFAIVVVGFLLFVCNDALSAEPSASPVRERQIIDEFKRLSRPIQCQQRELYNKFGSLYELTLSGAWKVFCDRYSAEELIYSLWSFLDDPIFDAEVVVLLYAKSNTRYTGGFLTPPFVDGHPLDWERHRLSSVRSCKWDIRREFRLGQDWIPHEIIFPAMSDDDLLSIKTNTNRRTELIDRCKQFLENQDEIERNSLELSKVLHALQIIDAWELTPELCNLFFFDIKTGQNYRLEIPKDQLSSEYFEYLEWTKQPESILPPISSVPIPSILYWRDFSARTNAIPFVLSRLSKTTETDRTAGVGGGFAEAIVIQYLLNPSLQLTQRKCLNYIDAFLASSQLTQDEKSTIVHFKETIKSGKYQNTEYAVGHGWFGNIPFDYRILENGLVLAGKTVGDRFFTYRFGKGKVGRIERSKLDRHASKILHFSRGASKVIENHYLIGEIGLYDYAEEQRLNMYIANLQYELNADLLVGR